MNNVQDPLLPLTALTGLASSVCTPRINTISTQTAIAHTVSPGSPALLTKAELGVEGIAAAVAPTTRRAKAKKFEKCIKSCFTSLSIPKVGLYTSQLIVVCIYLHRSDERPWHPLTP